MVQELQDFDFDSAGGGRSRYDWEKLFNGKTWKMTKGEDFYSGEDESGSAATFAAYVRQVAKQDKFKDKIEKVRVVAGEEEDGTEYIVIKATVKEVKTVAEEKTSNE